MMSAEVTNLVSGLALSFKIDSTPNEGCTMVLVQPLRCLQLIIGRYRVDP